MKDENVVYKKNEDVVARDIDGELFLLPLIRTRDEINALFTLTGVASRIWELLDGEKTLGQLKESLLQEYSVSEKTLAKDMEDFVRDAKEINIIKKSK